MKNHKEKFDYSGHPECSHNWIHYAGKQCDFDRETWLESVIKLDCDSNNIVYMYICTMCGGEFWSFEKMFDIPYYRVRGVRYDKERKRKTRKNRMVK